MAKMIRSCFVGLVVIALGRMAAAGKLPRNLLAGIRIPSTMRSDEAWRSGHKAASKSLTVAGLGPVLAALATMVASFNEPDTKAEKVLFRVGAGWLLGWLAFATVQANRAAHSVTS